MATTRQQSASTRKKNNIFISWSGENSKTFAKALKAVLEDTIFFGTDLRCFVSDVDIASGSDWWNKIHRELKACSQGILCITKENIRAPWIYFEAGAMVARDVPAIPLLVSCDVKSLDGSPLKASQCVNFYDQQQFLKMISDINKQMNLLAIGQRQLNALSKDGYEQLKTELALVLKALKTFRLFNAMYTYPSNMTTIKKQTVYVSAPMASTSDEEYAELRRDLPCLYNVLRDIGFSDIYFPLYNKPSRNKFTGKTKAIKENFTALKRVDCMVVIYQWNSPSSVLVEIGFGIALCKKMVIFYRDKLPYMLEKAVNQLGM